MDALASLPNMNVAANSVAAAQPALPSAGALPPAIPGMDAASTGTPSDAIVGANAVNGTSSPLGGDAAITLTPDQIAILTSLITALTSALSMLTGLGGANSMPLGGPSDPKATAPDKAVQLGGPSLDPTQNGLGGATTDPLQFGGPSKEPAKDPSKVDQSMPLGGPSAPTIPTSTSTADPHASGTAHAH
jgi:hypothetical protein